MSLWAWGSLRWRFKDSEECWNYIALASVFSNPFLNLSEDSKIDVIDADLGHNNYSVASDGAIGSGCMGGVYFNIQIIGDDQQQFANGGEAFQDMEEGVA